MEISQENKKIILFLSLITLLILVTRVPLYPEYFYHIDCGNFILALEDYDISESRPQPPGYYGFVALGNLANLVFDDPHLAFLSLSTLSNIILSITIFFLTRRMFGVSAAVIATLLSVFSPVFWFNSIVAFSYMTAAAFTIIFAYFAYLSYTKKDIRAAFFSSIFLALLGGVRQDCLLVFLPLWFLAIYRLSRKQIIYNAATLLFFCLLWFLPMISLSGGLDNYLSTVNSQYYGRIQAFSAFREPTNAWENTVNIFNTSTVAISPIFIITIILAFLVAFLRRKLPDRRINYLLVFLVPSIIFYGIFHFINAGYILPVLPALIILASASVVFLARQIPSLQQRSKTLLILITLLLVLICMNQTFLFSTPQNLYSTHYYYANIQIHDSLMAAEIATISSLPPSETLLLSPSFYFGAQHIRYYQLEIPFFEMPGYWLSTGDSLIADGAKIIYCTSEEHSELLFTGSSEWHPFAFTLNTSC